MITSLLRRVIPAYWRPIGHLTSIVQQGTGQLVATGPFRGLRYPASSFFSAYLPKLLGIYERELAQSIEAACAEHPGLIIDIGAAEGYYACGLAMRNPSARVIAFEMQEAGRAALAETIRLNQLESRVEVREKCEPADLAAVLTGAQRPLVICDVEGYEAVLLDPATVPALAHANVLVELHEFEAAGVGAELENRFRTTHHVERVWQEHRSPTELPFSDWYTRLLPDSYLEWAVSEWRPERMSWLWMQPH